MGFTGSKFWGFGLRGFVGLSRLLFVRILYSSVASLSLKPWLREASDEGFPELGYQFEGPCFVGL